MLQISVQIWNAWVLEALLENNKKRRGRFAIDSVSIQVVLH